MCGNAVLTFKNGAEAVPVYLTGANHLQSTALRPGPYSPGGRNLLWSLSRADRGVLVLPALATALMAVAYAVEVAFEGRVSPAVQNVIAQQIPSARVGAGGLLVLSPWSVWR